MVIQEEKVDARISAILCQVNVKVNGSFVVNKYATAIKKINEKPYKKVYTSLKSTLRESYLTGSLKYGKNFVL